MQIRCPTCASAYDLPSHLLTAGRLLRCAHCRDAWAFQDAQAEAPPASLALVAEVRSRRHVDAPSLPRRAPAPRRSGSRRIGASSASAAMLLATLAAGMTAVGQRERVVRAFPPSAAAFAVLGVPVNLRGLALKDVRSALAPADGVPTLTLDGAVANLRPLATAVPAIRIAVRNATGSELYSWTVPAPKARLAAGEMVPFHARLSAPPRQGETVAVSFTDAAPPAARHLAEASPAAR